MHRHFLAFFVVDVRGLNKLSSAFNDGEYSV